MNSLITAGILYVIAGSLKYIRRWLYPHTPNPSFDNTFGILLAMGIILLWSGMLNTLFPSDFAPIALLVILIGGTAYAISSLNVFGKPNTEKQSDKN